MLNTSFPYAGEPGCSVKLSSFDEKFEEPCVELECDSDVSEALIEQGSGLLYIIEKYYCDNKVDIDPKLTRQGSDLSKAANKAKERAKIKTALKLVLPSVRSAWRKMGLKYSRQQLLESMVPAAGKKGAAKEIIEAGKSLTDKRLSKVKKGVKHSMLKSKLRQLCSGGSKSFFVKFKKALNASAPTHLKSFVEQEAALESPPPPLPPPPEDHVELGNELFPVGSSVRVAVEDTGFKSYLGQEGKVKGSHGDVIEVCFNNFSVFGLAPVQIPSKLLEMVTLPMKPAVALKTMVRVSRANKQAFLECAEVLEPDRDVVSVLKVGTQASDDQIDVFSATVVWSLELTENKKVRVVPARFAGRILSDLNGQAYSDLEPLASPELAFKRLSILRRWLQEVELLLVPIWGKGSGPQHWTLLSIEGKKAEYRDSLRPLHQSCLANANKMLEALGIPYVENVVNNAVQSSDECGWFVCHWIEEQLRVYSGQPKHSQGWPTKQRLTTLQQWLKKVIDSLENERMKMIEEKKLLVSKEAELEAKLVPKAKAFLIRQGLLEKAVEVHRSLAKSLIEEGHNKEPPPLDAAFVKRLNDYREELERRRLEKLAAAELSSTLVAAELPSMLVGAAAAAELPPVAVKGLAADELLAVVVEGQAAAELPPVVVEPMPSAVEKLRLRLAEEGMEFFSVALETATVADLRPELRAHMEKVEKQGQGVCSKCRWLSGCMQCDSKKAWVYCLKVEMGLSTGQALSLRSSNSKGGGFSVEDHQAIMFFVNHC